MKKMAGIVIVLILIVVMATVQIASAAGSKDQTAWWVAKGVIEAKDNPLVKRAQEVFKRVLAASEARGGTCQVLCNQGQGRPLGHFCA